MATFEPSWALNLSRESFINHSLRTHPAIGCKSAVHLEEVRPRKNFRPNARAWFATGKEVQSRRGSHPLPLPAIVQYIPQSSSPDQAEIRRRRGPRWQHQWMRIFQRLAFFALDPGQTSLGLQPSRRNPAVEFNGRHRTWVQECFVFLGGMHGNRTVFSALDPLASSLPRELG